MAATPTWCYGDIITMVDRAGDRLDCIIVPKVEDQGQVAFVENLLNQIESKVGLERQIGLELQID